MLTDCAENAGVLAYLSLRHPGKPTFATWDSIAMPYQNAGCHPDIVERLWDQIGKALPSDCRILACGVPALRHPQSGVLLGLGLGTQYGLRLAKDLIPIACQTGAKTRTIWTGGDTFDIQQEFGSDWIFGSWHKSEIDWCLATFDTQGRY